MCSIALSDHKTHDKTAPFIILRKEPSHDKTFLDSFYTEYYKVVTIEKFIYLENFKKLWQEQKVKV